MAVPFDDATTFLTSLSNAVRTVYATKFEDQYGRFGRQINRLFKPGKSRVDGSGLVVQAKSYNAYASRVSSDLNGDFHTPRTFGVDTFTVTCSETPASNDLRRVACSIQLTHMDLKRVYSGKVSPVDFTAETIEQSVKDVAETIAIHRHLPASGLIGTIHGTPKKNDATTMTDASTLTTTGGARFQLSSASLAIFQPNRLIDVYIGSTAVKRYTVRVTDYNPADGSVGVQGLDANGAGSDTANIGAIAASDSLYVNGGYNNGLKSVGEWFKAPSSGESFFGRDRTATGYRWMNIHRYPVATAAAPVKFQPSYLDNLATQLGYINEDGERATLMLTTMEIESQFRAAVGNDVLLSYPTTEQKGELIASYGFDGLVYRHPVLGRLVLNPDPLCPPNRIRGLKIGDWETLFPAGYSAFEWLPGQNGMWYRMASSTPGNGDTSTQRADGMVALADICYRPREQWEMTGIAGAS